MRLLWIRAALFQPRFRRTFHSRLSEDHGIGMIFQIQRYARKHRFQLALKLAVFEFVHVKGIWPKRGARLRVVKLIRRGNQKLSGGRENAAHLA